MCWCSGENLYYASIQTTDDGKYVDTDYLVGHLDISEKKTKILLVTDRYLYMSNTCSLSERSLYS